VPNQRLVKTKGWVLETFILPRAKRDLLEFARSIQPGFVLGLAHRWVIPILHGVRDKIPAHWHLAIHDMPDTEGMITGVGRPRAARYLHMMDELYASADSRAVIGPGMAEDMRSRTGVDCTHYFRCAAEPDAIRRLAEPAQAPRDDVIRIGYAGTIVAESTFGRLIGALRQARERLGRPIELHLYTWHHYRARPWYDPTVIVEHGAKSEAEVNEAMQQYTWGLTIMNLEDDDPRYNRLSFPCKFTAALAAGVPLICIGNRLCALIELAKNYELGITLTDADADVLVDKLCAGLADFSRFPHYRAEALRCATTEFNAERNRQEFREMMTDAPSAPAR
jgi:glycosyltransferase involved in cell wall biosynthesis